MAAHFHLLKIKKVILETAESVSIIFEIPENIAPEFLYNEGQNITLKAVVNGEEIRRSYSLCTAPYENEIKVAVKLAFAGKFSTFAQTLKAGDVLEVLPPVGKFNARLKKGFGNYLAIAAGSGITPVLSIIKHTIKQQPESSFTLIYGNKSRGSIMFFEELESLKNKFMGRFNLIHILSREKTEVPLNYGRINLAKLAELQPMIDFSKFDSVYICGPEDMIFSTVEFLEKNRLERSKLHFELFTTPGQKQNLNTLPDANIQDETKPKSNITVKVDGRSFSFDLSTKGKSILAAALAQGADLPFACKGGVCSTCKAKLVSGNVKMDVNYALEPDEVEQGFILTCQSHPITENVVVDYDVK